MLIHFTEGDDGESVMIDSTFALTLVPQAMKKIKILVNV